MRTFWYWFIGICLVVVIIGLFQINKIPTSEENVSAKWSTLLSQYKRRADLIPQLVNTVKGSKNFEKETLTDVINARAKATAVNIDVNQLTPETLQKFDASQAQLSHALSRLLVTVERYPELKSIANFQNLMAQLEGTENRINVARKDYIDAVQAFNTQIKTFPGVMVNAIVYRRDILPQLTQAESVEIPVNVSFKD